MSNFQKRIELFANLAIIAVALLIGVVFLQRYVLDKRGNIPDQIVVGTKVSMSGVNWAQNKQTLLVVLQKGCHFCSESAAFYRQLAKAIEGRDDLHVVAVLPQQVGDSKQYLSELEVPINDVKQASLDTIGVRGTPTIIIVDSRGVVVRSWVGKLPSNKEAEVFAALRDSSVAHR